MLGISSSLFAVALLYAGISGTAAAQSSGPQAGDAADLEALLNQPVYAASKFAQDAAVAPAAVTVLTAGDIRAFGWRTIAEVLNGVRGVYFRYDRNYNYVGVRGLGRPGDFSSRLLVLVDGMRVRISPAVRGASGAMPIRPDTALATLGWRAERDLQAMCTRVR